MKQVNVAVVQASPALFDLEAGIQKVSHYTSEAARNGAELVLFPEAYLPGYPWGMSFGTIIGNRKAEGRDQWLWYWQHAVMENGPAMKQLGEIANQNNVFLVVGVIEKELKSDTLYCTIVYFNPDGQLIHKHRKIKPTASERIIWGEGPGDDLEVLDLPIGRLGGLICWENYMPMARMALYQQKVQIYLAPTADQRDNWQATVRHIALEGRCFVLGCNQFVTASMFPASIQPEVRLIGETLSRGGSVIISPLGEIVAGPLFDKEGILYGSLDMDQVIRGKMDFDVVGHYSRADLFRYEYIKSKKSNFFR